MTSDLKSKMYSLAHATPSQVFLGNRVGEYSTVYDYRNSSTVYAGRNGAEMDSYVVM